MAGQVIGPIIVAVVIALGFGIYYLNSSASLSSLSSRLSTDSSNLYAAESAASVAQSSISSMASRISVLSSEISAIECPVSASGSTLPCLTAVNTTTTQGPNPDLITVSGNLHVPTGLGTGTLDVTIYNGLNESIVSISVDYGVLVAPYGPMQFNYSGSAVSNFNPLPYGKYAQGESTVSSGSEGLYFSYGYSFTFTITLQNGQVVTKQLSLTAGM